MHKFLGHFARSPKFIILAIVLQGAIGGLEQIEPLLQGEIRRLLEYLQSWNMWWSKRRKVYTWSYPRKTETEFVVLKREIRLRIRLARWSTATGGPPRASCRIPEDRTAGGWSGEGSVRASVLVGGEDAASRRRSRSATAAGGQPREWFFFSFFSGFLFCKRLQNFNPSVDFCQPLDLLG